MPSVYCKLFFSAFFKAVHVVVMAVSQNFFFVLVGSVKWENGHLNLYKYKLVWSWLAVVVLRNKK